MKSLTASLQEYLKVRRSVGYQLNTLEEKLKKFIAYMKKKGCDYITVKLAVEWATLPQNAKRYAWSRRLSAVRLFAQYRKIDDPRTEIPPSYLLSSQCPTRPIPYIYRDKEIHQLLEACHLLPWRGLRRYTYYTFFGLMAVTGCRISELISLNRDDLDVKMRIPVKAISDSSPERSVVLAKANSDSSPERTVILAKSINNRSEATLFNV